MNPASHVDRRGDVCVNPLPRPLTLAGPSQVPFRVVMLTLFFPASGLMPLTLGGCCRLRITKVCVTEDALVVPAKFVAVADPLYMPLSQPPGKVCDQ